MLLFACNLRQDRDSLSWLRTSRAWMMLYLVTDTQTLSGIRVSFNTSYNKLYSIAEMQPFPEGSKQLFDKHYDMRLGFCTVHPVSSRCQTYQDS